MASSQVEMALSSPFGCVLQDQNRRDGCNREGSIKWRKFLAKDQNLHTRVSDENENSCWLPNNLQFSGENSSKGTNSSIKEGENFPSRKAEEMAATKTETLPLPRLDNLAAETPNLGAASLVQIWEQRLSRPKSGSNSNMVVSADSGLSCNVNNTCSSSSSSSPRSSEAEAEDSVLEERFDSSADWHSDRTASPCQSWNSDIGESERVRVADIIKRLWATNQGQSTLPCSSSGGNDNCHEQSNSPRDCLSPVWSDQMDQRFFSPRIRGRQAFSDLLIRMEKERHGELNGLIERRAVSSFPQKGRIQSMLRLRLLQRGAAVQDRRQQARFTAASQEEKLPQGSYIMHLREKFSIGVEHCGTSQSDATANHRSPGRETTNNTANFKNLSIPKKPDGQIQYQEVNFMDQQDMTTPIQDPPVREIECIHEEPGHSFPAQDTITLVQDPPVHDTEDIHDKPSPLTPVQDPPAHNIKDIHEELIPCSSITWHEMSLDCTNFDAQETSSEDRNLALQETAGTADASTSCGVWDGKDVVEEPEDKFQERAETSHDWISDISRPRSYWEDLRKEWYHEMLNSNSDKAEIRQLLERGTVSGFLASDFRERMDRLMATRLEIRQAQLAGGSQGGDEDEGHSQLLSFIQNHQQRQEQHEIEEEQEQEGEGEKEEESLTGGQYHEAGDYFDQSTSSPEQVPLPTLQRSWSSQDNDFGDDSDRAASTSRPQNFPSQEPYYHAGWRCFSSRNHASIEMELICELRGQMEQLHQEMSEIRKSLKSCMDMQMILMQQSMNQDVHSVDREKKSFGRATRKKGNCFICYKMKIDSLLYRCGHMCTCLKCAHELQWSSGKCPICRAPIVDVVRAILEVDS